MTEMGFWIDGRSVEADALTTLATVNYGHFTAMQVRDGRVRGLDVHLGRVDAAHRELFGHGLQRDWVRDRWSQAIADQPDASLRATFYDDSTGETHVAIVVRAPVDPSPAAQRLQSVTYIRPVAHLKHVGTFAQIYYGERAERAGYDDALLVDAARQIAETTMANVGFVCGQRVIWPTAPMLDGIGQQLLTDAASRAGLRTDRAPVSLDELETFDGAFTINSVGVVPIESIDSYRFGDPDRAVGHIVELHRRLEWDEVAG